MLNTTTTTEEDSTTTTKEDTTTTTTKEDTTTTTTEKDSITKGDTKKQIILYKNHAVSIKVDTSIHQYIELKLLYNIYN